MSQRQLAFILCICINIAKLSCVPAQTCKSIDNVNANNNYILPAYAIASLASQLPNSTLCEKELQSFRDAVDERIFWSLKVLDSSGTFQSGFLFGNNFWLGSRIQCVDAMNNIPLQISQRHSLNKTLYHNSQMEIPPFEVNYFVVHFKHNSTLQYHINLSNEDVIMLGLCLPASCSVNDISFILERIFHNKIFLIGDIYSANFELIQVKDLKNDYKWLMNGATPFICIILVLSIFMVIIGTIYDIFIHQKCTNKEDETNNKINTKNGTIQEMEMEGVSSLPESKLGMILICFSAYTNTKVIFNTKLHPDTLPIIHGLRFLNMCWVIVAHCVIYIIDYLDNKVWASKVTSNFIFQIVTNASLSVDTFFFLSGFLMSYFYLKDKMDKNRMQPLTFRAKLNEFLIMVIRRFIRLTPAYVMTLLISQLSSTWLDKISPFYLYERPHENCPKYWWKNLLYINNFSPIKNMRIHSNSAECSGCAQDVLRYFSGHPEHVLNDFGTSCAEYLGKLLILTFFPLKCMSWSWYLSADMQFFIIGLALLILSTTYFVIAVVILVSLLIGSIIFTGYLSYIYEFIPTLDEQQRLADVLYFPSWVRISPYIIGIIIGYISIRLNGKFVLKRRTVILCWCLGSACNLSMLFGIYKRQVPILYSTFYIAFHRGIWAIGIAWIVIACLTQHGGIINDILSFKGWVPFSRLSYCAYLINPFIIHFFHLQTERSVHFELISMIVTSIGFLGIIYFCSYILSLLAETPYSLLLRKIMQTRNRIKYKWRNSEKL